LPSDGRLSDKTVEFLDDLANAGAESLVAARRTMPAGQNPLDPLEGALGALQSHRNITAIHD
jgi:hypothetical protein